MKHVLLLLVFWSACCRFGLYASPPGNDVSEGITNPSMEMLNILERIQNQWMKRKPGMWTSELYSCDVLWKQKMTGMRSAFRYTRRIRETPDHMFLVAENWNLNPGDLSAFMAHWGKKGIVCWEDFHDRCQLQKGQNRIFCVPQEGLICVWRFFPSFEEAWKTPPFALNRLTEEELVHSANYRVDGRVKQFFSDMFLEEILDRNGLGFSLSKTWHFKDRFSRFTANVRFQRRLRLNHNGLYSVFDTFQLRGEALLGNVIEKERKHFYNEIGPFLGIKKEVVVIQSGFKTWSRALFAKPFNPRKLPFTQEKMRELPVGIRIVYPHQATLALVAKTDFNYFNSNDLSQKLRSGLSIKGSVMVSIFKEKEDSIVLKMGSRVEKLVDAYFDLEPDFDGNLDPLRLLFGSIVKLDFESGRGKLVDLQKTIDLNSPDEVRLLTSALKKGMQLKGIGFGLQSALYFIFHPNREKPLEHFKRRIPEINWDKALLGSYRMRKVYSKAGARPISFRRSTEMIGDDWELIDYQTNVKDSGYTISMDSKRNWRSLSRNTRRDLQIHGMINDRHREDVTMVLLDLTRDNHWTKKRLLAFQEQWEQRFNFPLSLSPSQVESIAGRSAKIGFRLLISLKALEQFRDKGNLDHILKSGNELRPWFMKHRVLCLTLQQAIKVERWFWVSRIIYKMVRKGAPLSPLLEALNEHEYSLEWIVENSDKQVMVQEKRGDHVLSRRQVMDWQWWIENRAFEDIFVDVSLTAEK